jgi:hypothetical protein
MSKFKNGGRTHIASKDARKLWKAVKQMRVLLNDS